jgi:predicted DCC family thiol-disulfide oxidoreductase YuxK
MRMYVSRADAVGDSKEQAKASAASSSGDWRELAESVFATDERPIILYDGVCNLCNGGVNFMLDWDSPNEERGNFRFAALQSNVGRALLQRSGRKPDDQSSIILALKDGSTYAKGDAVLRIGKVQAQAFRRHRMQSSTRLAAKSMPFHPAHAHMTLFSTLSLNLVFVGVGVYVERRVSGEALPWIRQLQSWPPLQV